VPRLRFTSAAPRRLVVAAATATLALLPLGVATASADTNEGHDAGAVFVQLNSTSGNEIAAYSRDGDGLLTAANTYPTGGRGGTEVGAPLDALASQNSLVLDRERHRLIAVNAGSNTITAFAVRGAKLRNASVLASGGEFPSSVAVRGNLVYVLNAGGDGTISGFRFKHGSLQPLPGSTRSLGLGNTNPPSFISAPAQVGFSGNGHVLIITTKNHNQLLTFTVNDEGLPSDAPTSTPSAGAVPFSFVVDQAGNLQVTEAGTGKTSSYATLEDGSLDLLGSSASTGGAALCWNVQIGDTLYGANSGSSTLSAWHLQDDGTATLTDPVAATTSAGPIDLAATSDGQFLYVQESIAGTLGVYKVSADDSLDRVQTVTGLPAFSTTGMEGVVAS
jgi:6-phosphogluconolactonase (cycloisomerase 2 family)